jgi:hypothetical protein
MELRRQLRQALAANAEQRALIDEILLRIATLERRCAELEAQLQRALSLAERREPPSSGQAWDAGSAASTQVRATILATELAQVRRERTESAEQCDRLLHMLARPRSPTSGSAAAPSIDYSSGRTELVAQIRTELEVRDRFAQWESEHRPRETDRRLDPTRDVDEQAVVATIAVRWQLFDHAPHSFPHRPQWEIDGVLLDPASEQFLTRQSRERVAYRERIMAAHPAGVT